MDNPDRVQPMELNTSEVTLTMEERSDMGSCESEGRLVSVVMPVFNRVAFLDEAIESVIAQTYHNWELILVDHGSNDGSFERENEWAFRYPNKIRCVTHEGRINRGISATRNLGTQVARGSYIACLDSDDMWVPEKLAKQIQILKKYPEVGLVVGSTLYWHPDEPRLDMLMLSGGPRDTLVQPPQLFYDIYPIGKGTAPSMNTVLLRKDVIDGVGGWEESFRTTYEDQAMLTKVYLSAPAYIASDQGDIYRQHAASIMRTELVGIRYFRRRYLFLRWLEAWMRKEQPHRVAELKLVQEQLNDRTLRAFRDPVRYNTWRALLKARRILKKITGWSRRT